VTAPVQTSARRLDVLLVEDNAGDARLIARALAQQGDRFCLEIVEELSAALDRLGRGGIDVVLLDLSLPDSEGLETFTRLYAGAPGVPIVVLSGLDDEKVALQAVQDGAQDYLVKRVGPSEVVIRALRYAVERHRIEGELRRAKEEADAANRAKTQLVAVVSHEFRSSLSSVLGFADLLLESTLDPEQQDQVQRLMSSANVLLRLVNDLLEVSTAEARAVGLQAVECDLRAFVDDLQRRWRIQARGKGLDLECVVGPEVPRDLVCDPERLQQILDNLVGNAIKFTGAGNVRVRVQRDPAGSEPGALVFSVSDSGIGIPKDKTDTIFESFTQADSTIHRRFGGSGLGLAVCKLLVERMGGRIRVESEPGKGSTFSFTLNVALATDAVRRAG
jgi:signal transduction histidine kinase